MFDQREGCYSAINKLFWVNDFRLRTFDVSALKFTYDSNWSEDKEKEQYSLSLCVIIDSWCPCTAVIILIAKVVNFLGLAYVNGLLFFFANPTEL